MHEPAAEMPTVMETDAAVVQQQSDFGDATDFTKLSAERMQFSAGTDIAPLLEGLEDDTCQVPHWGYVLSGAIDVTYADGTEEVDAAGDLFYWPPGHSVSVDEDSEIVLFSPQAEHREVFDHMAAKMEDADAPSP
jgi:ethanolamine utilization protein EutQ (cupin superfamily)